MARYRKVAAQVADLRQTTGTPQPSLPLSPTPPPPQPEPEVELSYRDLQAMAKERGIAANQSADELRAALGE